MKKSYFLITTIFLTSSCIICLLSAILAGCEANPVIKETENVTFILPQWPPQSNSASPSAENSVSVIQYPELSRWHIQIAGITESDQTSPSNPAFYDFYTSESEISLKIKKNIPLSITAAPLTILDIPAQQISDSEQKEEFKECYFFYSAGTIYPYSLNSESMTAQLSWEEGFCADLLQKIYRSTLETEISEETIKNFNSSFNWKKCQETINKKIEETSVFYNPWQIDSETLLNNLCYATFSANLLTVKNTISLSPEAAGLSDYSSLLLPYIPENDFLQNHNLMVLKKNTPEILLCNRIYAAQITAASSKKVSVEFTYMPILCKSYENSE